tara:strand:+ start:3566 stop:4333 length:768 start_codon:yes stop_codon:yes gene_type:complete
MNYIVVIPTRMSSSRYPNKPIKKILGLEMISHCYKRVNLVIPKDKIFISSCDNEIREISKKLNANFIYTSNKCKSATERTYEAFKKIKKNMKKKIKIIIMVQGDEPLLIPSSIKSSLNKLKNKKVNIINVLSKPILNKHVMDQNNVKALVNKTNKIIYFSRESIPSNWKKNSLNHQYIQTGIIGFKTDYLIKYFKLRSSKLEDLESIDMNRFIDNNVTLDAIKLNKYTFGVDTHSDLRNATKILKNDIYINKYIK